MDCILCRGAAADEELNRLQVWENELWRLTTSLYAETHGFSYLEPKRHISYVTDLDGPEAATFGPTLARVTSALKEATGSELVYVYVFGGSVPHLHLHLAPHSQGDALNDTMLRGEVTERKLPNGLVELISDEFPPLPREDLEASAERIRALLA